ncbi:MAG: DNA gyrase subunit A [Candidatus Eutrophobiaceae bacterium]
MYEKLPKKTVTIVNIEDEMRQSYMGYAMSVIVGRALPDVRDGLKPVHRRVLYAMNEVGNDWNKKHIKSSRVVGDVMGKYHPHGESAIYNTIVRMAQDFSLRYVLIDGQGNFGSVDGDTAAAARYTEVRMSRIAHDLLRDIDKETVDFVPNYDGVESEPTVLPTHLPNLLINGSSGIAVGMATNIPPHNLGETIDACLLLLENPEADIAELMKCLPGPDFPTAAIINGIGGIHKAYTSGRGKLSIRARHSIETDDKGMQAIIIHELPYQVNKANLLMKIARLVKEKQLSGIRDLRDESDRQGMRMVIELRRNEVAEVILNNLYKHTELQNAFNINLVALIGGQPKLMGLKDILHAFLDHRREVITRRSLFELRKARARALLLEGLAVALENLDEIVKLIRQSPNAASAKEGLMGRPWQHGSVTSTIDRDDGKILLPADLANNYGLRDDGYHLSPEQAQAILDLRLQKLTGMEREKLAEEYRNLLAIIANLLDILSDTQRLEREIREELVAVRAQHNDPRRTEIRAIEEDPDIEDLIAETDMVVTLSYGGYAKTQPLDSYQSQRRGGKGKSATSMKDEDFIDRLLIANTHDTLLCFSSQGKVYWIKVYRLPQAGRGGRGKPMVNLLPLDEGERINFMLPIREYSADRFLLIATANGVIKKTSLQAYSNPRQNGIRAVNLDEGDSLIGVELTDGTRDIMLFTNVGKAARFKESEIRTVGRVSRGVRGIKLQEGQKTVSLIIVEPETSILTATRNGYGKRTPVEDYPVKSRSTRGVIAIQISERNGELIGAMTVTNEDETMLISNEGTLIRSPVKDIRNMGRNTQGVRLLNLGDGAHLVYMQRVVAIGEDLEGQESESQESEPQESQSPD